MNFHFIVYAVIHNYVEGIRLLISAGADLSGKNSKNGMPPLRYAVDEDKVEIVKLLLAAGADPNGQLCDWQGRPYYDWGISAVRSAIERKKTEMLQLLLFAGADSNAQYKLYCYNSLLVLALRDEYIEGVKLLLAVGADPSTCTELQRDGYKVRDLFKKREENYKLYTAQVETSKTSPVVSVVKEPCEQKKKNFSIVKTIFDLFKKKKLATNTFTTEPSITSPLDEASDDHLPWVSGSSSDFVIKRVLPIDQEWGAGGSY